MPHEKLSLKSKLAYGALGAGIGLPNSIAFSAITFFYNIKLGLDASYIGIAWLIFSIWNAINDPIFGFIEDNTKSEKYGRRIPYIRFGAPLYGITFILCWIPFVSLNNQIALFFNFLIVLLVFDTMFTILGLINFTLPAEMAITAKERANLLIYSSIISSISYLISFMVPLFLLTGSDAPASPRNFVITMVIIGILSAVILFISSFSLKENKYTQLEDTLPLIKGIKETFKNKPFLVYELANVFFTIAQTILTTAIFYYGNYILRLPGFLNSIPLMIVFLMIFVFIIVFNKLVGWYGVKKTFISTIFISGVGFFLTFFMGWKFITSLPGFILIGIGFSGFMLLNQVVVADIVDYDEIRTGKRRETTYSGINALITKPAISLANWLFLTIITSFNFEAGQPIQGFSSQFGIMLGFALIPSIFLTFGAFTMLKYSLDGSQWLLQKEKIIKIHAEKEDAYLKHLEKNKTIGK
ncbi:MAG: MFS transporter [Promethearchaeota archaeon]|jgi:GPH family glycoside/pentoside/hexuronide:cation symporter